MPFPRFEFLHVGLLAAVCCLTACSTHTFRAPELPEGGLAFIASEGNVTIQTVDGESPPFMASKKKMYVPAGARSLELSYYNALYRSTGTVTLEANFAPGKSYFICSGTHLGGGGWGPYSMPQPDGQSLSGFDATKACYRDLAKRQQ